MNTNTRSRSWFLTINKKSYTDKINYAGLENYVKSKLNADYFAFCEEKGHGDDEHEGNEHLHLYLELINPVSFSSIQKKFNGAHIEVRRGNPSEMRNYIFKIGSPKNEAKADTNISPAVEFGNWDNYKNIIARGSTVAPKISLDEKIESYINQYNSIEEIEDIDPWTAKQYKDILIRKFKDKKRKAFIEKHCQITVNSRGDEVIEINRKVYYLFGESRCGKSYGVRFKYGSTKIFAAKSNDDHPFDNYNGEDVLLLDEFRSSMSFSDILTLLDVYPVDLPARYADRSLFAHTIILASNISFDKQYENMKTKAASDYQAFRNRFINGIWELVYDEIGDKRYICCLSKLSDFTGKAKTKCDFSDPPIECDGDKSIHISDIDEFRVIKYLIINNKEITPENIERQKEVFRVAYASLPF